MDRAWIIIGIIVCFIILIIAVCFLVFGLTNKPPPGTTCTSAAQCLSTQNCSNGFCLQKSCLKNSDCGLSQTCSYGFCNQNTCQTNIDCASGHVCQKGLCVAFGETCTTALDCNNNSLSCVNQVCSQCATNQDCGTGFCGSDHVCYPTCNSSKVTCPSSQVCVNDHCCPAGTTAAICTTAKPCTTGFCVNGKCSCAQGNNGNTCLTNNDCSSGNCLGGVCLTLGATCFANFDPKKVGVVGYCQTTLNPYCASGNCAATSLEAPCLYSNSSAMGATLYNSCNQSGNTTQTTTYCVNGFCTLDPGAIGASCTSNFDCSPVNGVQTCGPSPNRVGTVCM